MGVFLAHIETAFVRSAHSAGRFGLDLFAVELLPGGYCRGCAWHGSDGRNCCRP